MLERKAIRVFRLLILLLSLMCTLMSPSGLGFARPLRVTASILPIADWVRNVGGDRVSVSCVLAGGSSPHTFTPSPSDVTKLARADVFMTIGVGLEEWAQDFITAAGKRGLTVVKLGERIGFKDGANPHVWLDPNLAKKMVLEVAATLGSLDPQSRALYEKNARRYVSKINALDRRFARKFAALGQRSVVQFHPAFTYFLRHYGIGVLDVIEPHPGKRPSSKHLQQIILRLRKQPRRIVLIEPQLSSKAAVAVAHEANASLVTLDPLGDQTVPSRSTYLSLMEFDLNALLESLR